MDKNTLSLKAFIHGLGPLLKSNFEYWWETLQEQKRNKQTSTNSCDIFIFNCLKCNLQVLQNDIVSRVASYWPLAQLIISDTRQYRPFLPYTRKSDSQLYKSLWWHFVIASKKSYFLFPCNE